MFIGHYAIALAGKRAAPRTSLGTLVLAAQWLDLIWPSFLLIGVEHVSIQPASTVVTPLNFYDYPYSHSLVTAIGWGIAFALVYFGATRYARGAWIAGLAVVSHWLLDALVHRPDLPLFPHGRVLVGLGLWNSRPSTLALELSMFTFGLLMYLRTTEAADATGRFGLWGLIVFLIATYLGSIFGTPPTSVSAVAWLGLGQWMIVAWGFWVDNHRRARA